MSVYGIMKSSPQSWKGCGGISYTDICFADHEKAAEPKLRERGRSNEQE